MSGINAMVAHFGINFETKEMPQDGNGNISVVKPNPTSTVYLGCISHGMFYFILLFFYSSIPNSTLLQLSNFLGSDGR
jgi:hypothetical protein